MIVIRFQKPSANPVDDDVIRINKTYYGTYQVSTTCYNGHTSHVREYNLFTLYEYIDTLFEVFQADTPTQDNNHMDTVQIDISGFPSFLVGKNTFYEFQDSINRAIEFWVSA
jgi:hypothetical protein